ncbi:MAG: redoxin domain-containing protein [Ktedonobacterales bacterium]|nr:redoxin domain-containing protein [Ktedonobacterales bacterium]
MKQLQAGMVAPLFSAMDVNGREVRLDQFAGQPVLLSFYRSAACQLCSLRLWYLRQQLPALSATGLRIIGIFETSRETTLHYAQDISQLIPTIADPQQNIFRLYQARRRSLVGFLRGYVGRFPEVAEAMRRQLGKISDGNHLQLPADFLLAPDLTIVQAYYGRDIGDHLPFAVAQSFAEQFQRVR